MALSNVLNKKRVQDILNGKAFQYDYNQRIKVKSLENKIFEQQQKQTELIKENGDVNVEEYLRIDSIIAQLKLAVQDIESKLKDNLAFEMMIIKMAKEENIL